MGRRAKESPEVAYIEKVVAFIRLSIATHRIANVPAPVNTLLVGPPGDGKTAQLMRFAANELVFTLSDASWMGLINYLKQCRQGYHRTLLMPDLGSLVTRDASQVKKVIGLLSAATEEGVHRIAVGKWVENLQGTKTGLVSAITLEDLSENIRMFNVNAFLSRMVLPRIEWTPEGLKFAKNMQRNGDMRLLKPVRLPRAMDVNIVLPPEYARESDRLWVEMTKRRSDRTAGFRTGNVYESLLRGAAYLRESHRVNKEDVKLLVQVHHDIMLTQFEIGKGVGT